SSKNFLLAASSSSNFALRSLAASFSPLPYSSDSLLVNSMTFLMTSSLSFSSFWTDFCRSRISWHVVVSGAIVGVSSAAAAIPAGTAKASTNVQSVRIVILPNPAERGPGSPLTASGWPPEPADQKQFHLTGGARRPVPLTSQEELAHRRL